MVEAATSERRLRGAENRERAVELRKAGVTYERIAAQLGITRQSAHEHVTKAMRQAAERTTETAVDVVRLELARLDTMLTGLWTQARQGDPPAIDRVLRIMERRARLLGLDAEGPAAASVMVVEVAWPAPDPVNQPEPLIIEGETL